jgi:multidrug transporter EmrE-like cation transporter
MTSVGWVLILLSSVCMAVSSLLLRLSIDRIGGFYFHISSIAKLVIQPLFLFGCILYCFAVIGWFRIIASETLNVAYPLMMTITFTLVTMLSFIILKEPIGLYKIIGLVLIISGITLMSQ